ncbi:MAG: hypothetical protein HC765_10760 [Brachymonas sp.]|nr:hypothetical protein [Brachymonas sp.]
MFEDSVLISAVVVGWGDTDKWGSLAKPAHRFMSFDKATGELRWMNGTGISPYDTTYSTPTIMPLGGQQARRLVVDIGGRSTELIVGRGHKPLAMESYRVGSVAWADKYFADGQLSAQAFDKAIIAAKAVLDEAAVHFQLHGDPAYGSAGTIGAIADILQASGGAEDVVDTRAWLGCGRNCSRRERSRLWNCLASKKIASRCWVAA